MPAESSQSALNRRLEDIRRIAEERDAERRAKHNNHPYVDLTKVPIATDALKLIPEETARAAKVAAIEYKAHELAVAMYDPLALAAKQVVLDLEKQRYTVKIFTASLSGLEGAWKMYKFITQIKTNITDKVKIEKLHFEELLNRLTTFQAIKAELEQADFRKISTTTLFETILTGALSTHASDIHFEAEEKKSRIRFRLDGLLHDIYTELPIHNYEALLSRIKLLSGLKINIYGEPQDGRFTVDLPQKEVEMRVSIVPSEFGETIVMRVLDPDAINVTLEGLGLRQDILELAKRELSKPNGLILNTGPTGSGKTTTLYAFLKAMLDPELKIITIEDPIEYRIEGIEQTQTHNDTGYTFAGGLRAMMRQDPDVILVGEIRDEETANIAMQASLTGHLVLSTLHANDSIATIPRLTDLGVKPETIGPALSLIIAQRLVRILCEHCKKEVVIDEAMKKKIEDFLASLPEHVNRDPYKTPMIFEAVGCVECNNLGYRGRRGIFEFLQITPELQELILKQTSQQAIREVANKQGIISFQKDGILKVFEGKTTFDEIEKITGPLTW